MKSIIKTTLFPCLLSFTVLLSILYIYNYNQNNALILFAAGVFIYNFLFFALYKVLFDWGKKLPTTVIVILGVIATFMAAGELIRAQGTRMNVFTQWFFSPREADYYPFFVAGLMILFVPFISAVVFYFTAVRYKAFFLMLTCMITFALYAKTFTVIPFIFPSLIIALFLFVSIENRWYKKNAENALNYPKFVIIGICFVTISVYLAGLFPPVEVTPYREQFDEFITGRSIALAGAGMAELFSTESSGKPDNGVNTEMLLYRVKTDSPAYLKRQVYDNWDGEVWRYYGSEEYKAYFFNPEVERALIGEWRAAYSELSLADESNFLRYAPAPFISEAEITIMTDLEVVFLPVPQYVVGVKSAGRLSNLSRSLRDEFYFRQYNKRGETFTVEYYDNYVSREFLSGLTAEAADTLEETGITNYMFKLFPFDYDVYLDSCAEIGTYPERSKVRELSLSLTEGIESDYGKAKAIESYFYNGEFTYDMDFDPESKAADYFLFESKRGTCSDFASAMTIMCREAGLPARYVEGYVMRETDENGDYLIRVKHAHSFPEVFINGWGWVIFEPTIPDNSGGGFDYAVMLTVLISSAALFGFAIAFVFIALPRIREKRFRERARRSPPETQVRLLYNRIYGGFMKRLSLRERTLSSGDLHTLASSEYGKYWKHSGAIKQLTENYDRVVYGGLQPEECDFIGVYDSFKKAEKLKKKAEKSKELRKPAKPKKSNKETKK